MGDGQRREPTLQLAGFLHWLTHDQLQGHASSAGSEKFDAIEEYRVATACDPGAIQMLASTKILQANPNTLAMALFSELRCPSTVHVIHTIYMKQHVQINLKVRYPRALWAHRHQPAYRLIQTSNRRS